MKTKQALWDGRPYMGEGWAELMNLKSYSLEHVPLSQRWLFQLGMTLASPGMGQQNLSFLGATVLEQCLFLLVEGTCCSCHHPCGLAAYPLRHPTAPNHENSSLSSLLVWVNPAYGMQSGQYCPPQLKSESLRQIYWENCAVGKMAQVILGIVMSVAHGRKQMSGRKNWPQTLYPCGIPSGPLGLTILGAG